MFSKGSGHRMGRRVAGLLAAVVTAGTVSLAGAAPASAIEPCEFWTPNPLSLQEFPWGGQFDTCWANAGTTWVNLRNVRLMESGNNAGFVTYTTSRGSRATHYFGKFQRAWFTDDYAKPVTITRITIY